MKRVFRFTVLSLLVCLCATGCGEKKLVCTQEEEGMNIESTITYDSKGNAKSMKSSVFMEYPEGFSKKDAEEKLKEDPDAFSDAYGDVEKSGVKVDTKLEDKGIRITMSGAIETFIEAGEFDEEDDLSYDALKKSAEEDGATCK